MVISRYPPFTVIVREVLSGRFTMLTTLSLTMKSEAVSGSKAVCILSAVLSEYTRRVILWSSSIQWGLSALAGIRLIWS